MKRREFLRATSVLSGTMLAGSSCRSIIGPARAGAGPRVRWTRASRQQLFNSVACDGEPLLRSGAALLVGEVRPWSAAPGPFTRLTPTLPVIEQGPLSCELRHELRSGGDGKAEDVLEAKVTVRNRSSQSQLVELALLTHAQPTLATPSQELYLPLNAAGLFGDKRFIELGVHEFLRDCRVTLERDSFRCHYLEPLASHPGEATTRALLLAPVIHVSQPSAPWRVALFTASDQPARFDTTLVGVGREWRTSRVMMVPPGATVVHRAWLMLHTGDAATAWRAFHQLAHEAKPPIDWVREFKVHYYDFLSSAQGKDGRRGDGYEADAAHFRDFRVGLATQHGYYPCMGDHLHPDRPTWFAMQGDKQGPAEMSLAKVRARIATTRAAGAKAAIYMHMSAWDDSSRAYYPRLETGRRTDRQGQPLKFAWNGPDVKGGLWWMSMASSEWRAHLLQQARWIMEILQPDAICMDETFSGLGYDFASGQPAPLSLHAIEFFKQLHALVRSYGPEKALFSSDCSMSGFSLWADGEVGDHAYAGLLGNPLYTQEPVRYLAALGAKPWRPCAWHFRGMWQAQMKLARQVGAGVGVSNGWIEYTGLARLSEPARSEMLADINSLFTPTAYRGSA